MWCCMTDLQNRIVEAMRARRRVLQAQPLDRIYWKLFEAGLDVLHKAQLAEERLPLEAPEKAPAS